MQKMMWDALQYRKMQSAPKPVAAKTLPPVQRPGTSNAVRVTESSAKVQSLEKQLSSATGDRAARIAAQLLKARRSA
jgi:hypothetical protein